MKKTRKINIGVTFLLVLLVASLFVIWRPSMIPRIPFSTPAVSFKNWDDILSHPQPISIQTYSTGLMETSLSGIMNLDHEKAQNIEDVTIKIPVNVSLIQHKQRGAYLIDAGLDSSYVHSPNGTMRGMLVKSYLGKGSQEPNTHIAAILKKENIQIQGVFLTHLHFDHTAGILDLPKDIPYVVSKGERYTNFTFIMRGDHLAGINQLYEIDFSTGIDLPPFGKSIDVFGDGSLWAISSSGHSKGHMLFLINGIDGQVLMTGDACNTFSQFDYGIGPGSYSSDLEAGQAVLDLIKNFKEQYPEIQLVFGHDLITY